MAKLPEVTYNSGVPSGGSVFRQMRGVPRKPVPAGAVSLAPPARPNQYTKVACLGVTRSATLQSQDVKEAGQA